MSLLDKIRELIGPKRYKKLRKKGYELKFWLYPTMDENQFQEYITQKLGIKKGDIVFVHSAMGKLNISFSAFKLLQVLKKIVSEEGLLLFPAWHFNYRAEEYLMDSTNVFDVKKSITVMGLLNEMARRDKSSCRSLHPTNSIVAIGKGAKEILAEHHLDVYPNGIKSPFYKSIQPTSKIIGLGEPYDLCLSFVHCIEDVMGDEFPFITRTKEVFTAKVIDENGFQLDVKTKAAHKAIAARNVKKYVEKHFSKKEIRTFKKGSSAYFVVDVIPFYKRMEELSKQGISIYKP